MKKAFTLAEVMITLTVIGIITAVIIPVAIQSKPDENILKFKKAHNTLYQTISTLVNSDKYYLNGNLVYKPDGSFVDREYFCKTFAEVVSPKFVDCNWTGEVKSWLSHYNLGYVYNNEVWNSWCVDALSIGAKAQIITTDGITFYEANQPYHFASKWPTSSQINDNPNVGGQLLFYNTSYTSFSEVGFNEIYKPICIDIDGIGKGEEPFAYGIRYDGKIVASDRVKEWLEKSIQGE